MDKSAQKKDPHNVATWMVNWAPVTPMARQESPGVSGGHKLSEKDWPSLIKIVEMDEAAGDSSTMVSDYTYE